MKRTLLLAAFGSFLVVACLTNPEANDAPGGAHTPFPHWVNGTACDTEPPLQVHRYADDLFILRQSKCIHFEAPFLYLLLGSDRALLLDTGSSKETPVAKTVMGLLDEHAQETGRPRLDLVVAHSHSHGDHIAGDAQFEGLERVTVVGTRQKEVEEFWGIEDWPNQLVTYDLGGRVIDVIPTPGHHRAHITLYDRETELLLTGDTLYPGFLFVFYPGLWDDFLASTQRMVDFAERNPVRFALGCHVEMQKHAGQYYKYGTHEQPEEHRLELGIEVLHELNDALIAMGPDPETAEVEIHDDFIIFPNWNADESWWELVMDQ